MPTYRMTIQLTESEYLALARIARDELRAPRWQAVHILKTQLVTLGEFNPAPQVDSITAQEAKHG